MAIFLAYINPLRTNIGHYHCRHVYRFGIFCIVQSEIANRLYSRSPSDPSVVSSVYRIRRRRLKGNREIRV